MMEVSMVSVPYGDFVDGVKAQADLDTIRAIVSGGSGYCSDDIMAVLGLQVWKKDIGNCDVAKKED